MSASLINKVAYGAVGTTRAGAHAACVRVSAAGVGMLEFLLALLIFTTGMAGLLSVQLAAKQATNEAARRSVATHLARDILERMQANPQISPAYQIEIPGTAGQRLPTPVVDCQHAACSAVQLAEYDLWNWESALLGESARYTDGNAGGLIAPRGCITTDEGSVTVVISWLAATAPAFQGALRCGQTLDTDTEAESGDHLQRRELILSTFIAVR